MRFQVHATITVTIVVDVPEGGTHDQGVMKSLAAQQARRDISTIMSQTPLAITGVATGIVLPLELHPLTGAFQEGAMGIGPDPFFSSVAGEVQQVPEIVDAEIVED